MIDDLPERALQPTEPAYEDEDDLIEEIKENAIMDALNDRHLLSTMITEMPNSEDGDGIIAAYLRELLDTNTSDRVRPLRRMSLALELEAMTERYLERCAKFELKRRGKA